MFLAYLLTNFVFVHILLTASKNSNWFTSYSLKDDNWLMIRLGSQLGWYPTVTSSDGLWLLIVEECNKQYKIIRKFIYRKPWSPFQLLAWYLGLGSHSGRSVIPCVNRRLKSVCVCSGTFTKVSVMGENGWTGA